jgi:dCMP deaminase
MSNWDEYFLNLCNAVASNSKCLSRQIGAILVKDNIVISTGYNGPARDIPPCNERFLKDEFLYEKLIQKGASAADIKTFDTCPRKILGFKSGEGLEWCPAVHAEKNCLLAAARLGIKTKGASLYINSTISSCTQCFSACIQAGIKEIVVIKNSFFDVSVNWCNNNSSIITREYNLQKNS